MALIDSVAMAWHCDEASGDLTPAVGGVTVLAAFAPGSAAGIIGGARSLVRASAQRFVAASTAATQMGDIPMAVMAWVNLSSTSAAMTIVSKWAGPSSLEYILYFDSNRFRAYVTSGGTSATATQVVANTFGTPSTGTWHQVFMAHDPGANTLSIGVNGGPRDIVTHNAGIFAGSANFGVGFSQGATDYLDGLIDEIVVWKGYVPTLAEVTRLYTDRLAYPFSQGIGLVGRGLCGANPLISPGGLVA